MDMRTRMLTPLLLRGSACLTATCVLVSLVPGCAPTRVARGPVVTQPAHSGQVGVELLPPGAGASRMQLASNQGFSYPTQVVQPMPEYPVDLLALRLPATSVCVDVGIDAEGNVGHVEARNGEDCPFGVDTQHPGFAQAVIAAVEHWRYTPAMVCTAPDADASPCAHPRRRETPTSVRLSYMFRFSQVDGRPSVDVDQATQRAR